MRKCFFFRKKKNKIFCATNLECMLDLGLLLGSEHSLEVVAWHGRRPESSDNSTYAILSRCDEGSAEGRANMSHFGTQYPIFFCAAYLGYIFELRLLLRFWDSLRSVAWHGRKLLASENSTWAIGWRIFTKYAQIWSPFQYSALSISAVWTSWDFCDGLEIVWLV